MSVETVSQEQLGLWGRDPLVGRALTNLYQIIVQNCEPELKHEDKQKLRKAALKAALEGARVAALNGEALTGEDIAADARAIYAFLAGEPAPVTLAEAA